MTKPFPQFLKQGRVFKMGFSHTKVGLMKTQNQTEAVSPVSQAVLWQPCPAFMEGEQHECGTAKPPNNCLESSVKKE